MNRSVAMDSPFDDGGSASADASLRAAVVGAEEALHPLLGSAPQSSQTHALDRVKRHIRGTADTSGWRMLAEVETPPTMC
jgi:hypothetical protein